MKNLLQLLEAQEKHNKQYRQYDLEHGAEISFLKYYNFLIGDFYSFFENLIQTSSKLEPEIKVYSGYTLSVEVDFTTAGLIDNFLSYYFLGNVVYQRDERGFIETSEYGNYKVTIEFNENTVKKVLDAFYEELQRVEYFIKSREEMAQDLARIKESQDIVRQKQSKSELKQSLTSVIEDDMYDKYYDFLRYLLNLVDSYMLNLYRAPDWYSSPHRFYIDDVNIEIYKCISEFLRDYYLGMCYFEQRNRLHVMLYESRRQIITNAFYMERQRLKYYQDEFHQR